jgi:hypothetical protein
LRLRASTASRAGRSTDALGWPICRRAVGDQRAAFRTINHELHSAIPRPASAENLQENFSFRLNKDPSRGLASRLGRRRLRLDIVVRVFNLVAHRFAFASLRIAYI